MGVITDLRVVVGVLDFAGVGGEFAGIHTLLVSIATVVGQLLRAVQAAMMRTL